MHYSSNRNEKTAESLFNGFNGYMQTDGYPGYNIVANKEGVTQLGCWAHARRKFADIIKSAASDVKSKTFTIEITGNRDKLNAFIDAVKDHTILELVRSGSMGISRGEKTLGL